MISVLSHQRLLNGNNFFLLLFLCVCVSSCGILEDLTGGGSNGRNRYPQHHGNQDDYGNEKRADTIKVDIVENPDKITDEDVALDEGKIRGKKKDQYKIAYMLPVVDDAFGGSEGRISDENKRYIEYYLGVKMAAEKLASDGLHLKLIARDASSRVQKAVFQSELQLLESTVNPDLIVGGSSSEQVEVLADFAKKHKCMAVSPFIPQSNVTTDNKYFVQLAPPLEAYVGTIVKDIYRQHRNASVILVAQQDFKNRFTLIQSMRDEVYGDEANWDQILLGDKDDIENLDKEDLPPRGEETVIIVPMDYKKIFVYKLLSKLFFLRNDDQLVVYGMPPWDKYSINFQLYENLEVYIPAMNVIDMESETYKAFQEAYYKKYSAIPSIQAIKGYDEMLFIGKMLMRSGIPFSQKLPEVEYTGLSTDFKFKLVGASESKGLFKKRDYDYVENIGLRLWRLSPE